MSLIDKMERRALRNKADGVPLSGKDAFLQGWDVDKSNPHPPVSTEALYWIADWWMENANSFADHCGVLARDRRNEERLVELELLKTPDVLIRGFRADTLITDGLELIDPSKRNGL